MTGILFAFTRAMRSININEIDLVAMDYTNPGIPDIVRQLQPVVFMDGSAYSCLLGPDPQSGVFARGNTPLNAVMNWVGRARICLRRNDLDEEVREAVAEALGKFNHNPV